MSPKSKIEFLYDGRLLVVALAALLAGALTIFKRDHDLTEEVGAQDVSELDGRDRQPQNPSGLDDPISDQPTGKLRDDRVIGSVSKRGKLRLGAVDQASFRASPAPNAQGAEEPNILLDEWLDPREKAGRRRVRISESDFKYPLLRFEEEVWTDPASGKQEVLNARASVADHVMVGRRPGVTIAALREQLEERGYRIRSAGADSILLIEIPDFAAVDAQPLAVAALAELDEFIEFAEPDYLVYPSAVPNDPLFLDGQMWGLDNDGGVAGSTRDADIDGPEGWDLGTDASGVVVAVTDTGIRYTHEDLSSNMWSHPVSGAHGYDAYDDDDDPMDTQGHGTHCAGTIGARGDNGKGIAGVAWQVQLMACRFLGENGGTTSDAIRVINYARMNGADIISASWGGGGYSQGLYAAIEQCYLDDIVIVAAAGNSSQDTDATPSYPASYDLPNIVSVAASNQMDQLSNFSNYGRGTVDLAAPGADILSCYHGSDQAYSFLNGTSMAAPHVSGALALLKAAYPSEDIELLIGRLYGSVDQIPAFERKLFTGGRLNLRRLISSSANTTYIDMFDNPLWFHGKYGYFCTTNRRATREADEDSFSPDTGERTFWFAWKAPANTLVQFNASSPGGEISVVAFEGENPSGLIRIADNFDDRPTADSTLSFYAKAGYDYRFTIGCGGGSGGLVIGRLTARPENDLIEDAVLIEGSPFVAKGCNVGATGSVEEEAAPHAGVGVGRSVWWRWRPDTDGQVLLSTTGSEVDTVLAVYSGPADNLTEVASNDDRNISDWTSQVIFDVTAGTTYHIAVDSFRDDSGGTICLYGAPAGLPVFLQPPSDSFAGLGGASEFSVVFLDGGSPANLRWLFDGAVIPGENRSELVINPVTAADFGTYQIEISNGLGIVSSEPAQLSELRTPPLVTFDSGNQSVVLGDPLRLTVIARGSLPLSYVWTKDGHTIPGASGASIEFPTITASDEGIYECTINNDKGVATVAMAVTAVESPFDGWEWRLRSVPGDSITDIKVIGGKVYAVAGERILVSDDAENWRPWGLPGGFRGRTLVKLGSRWICVGEDGTRVMASFTDGSIWGPPIEIPLLSGTRMNQMEILGDVVIGRAGDEVYFSDDGLDWQFPNVVGAEEGEETGLPVSGRLAFGAGKAVAVWRASIYMTSDGVNWSRSIMPDIIQGLHAAAFLGGRFYAFGSNGLIYENTDGTNWQRLERPDNWLSSAGSIGLDVGTSLMIVNIGAEENFYGWGESVGEIEWGLLVPRNQHLFTAAAAFMGRAVVGTSSGLLQSVAAPSEFRLPQSNPARLEYLVFLNGEFIACGTGGSAKIDDPVRISGDGFNWRESQMLGGLVSKFTGFHGGRYFGAEGNNGPKIFNGWAPAGMLTDNVEGIFPGRPVSSATDGIITIALVGPTSDAPNAGGLYLIDEEMATWNRLENTGLPEFVGDTIQFLDGQWFISSHGNSDRSTSPIYRSANGLLWSEIPGLRTNLLTELDGTLYALPWDLEGAHTSIDGLDWTEQTVTFPADFEAIVGSFDTVDKLRVFGGALVLMTSGGEFGLAKLFFSTDGAEWFRARAPGGIMDFEVAKGQLVALTRNGGVVQAGSPGPGGMAPVAEILYPPTGSSHFSGTTVEVVGRATDPEGAAVLVECLVNGESIGTSNSPEFEFSFTADDRDGHVIVVRATDDAGLVGSAEARVNIAQPATSPNFLASAAEENILPGTSWVEFGGAIYAVGGDKVFRSTDGINWERSEVPYQESILTLAKGNGALVIQFTNGSITTSRDGVNWTEFTPVRLGSPTMPLRFSGGRFVSVIYTYDGSSVVYSADGLHWQSGGVSEKAGLPSLVQFESGVMIGLQNSGETVYRSSDGGNNWFTVSGIDGLAKYHAALAAGGGRAIIALKDGRILASDDEGVTWVLQQTVAAFPDHLVGSPVQNSISLAYEADLFFLGAGDEWMYVSADGTEWEELAGEPVQDSRVIVYRGGYLASGFNGLLSSEDAVSWHPLPTSPPDVLPDTLVAGDGFALVADTNQAVWRTLDGQSWGQVRTGIPLPRNEFAIYRTCTSFNFNEVVVAGGTRGLLRYSEDGGLNWNPASIQGGPAIEDATFYLTAGEDFLLAIGVGPNNQGAGYSAKVYRSEDGRDWEHLRGLRFARFLDLAIHPDSGKIVALAIDGTVWTSEDRGITWSPEVIPNLESAGSVHFFDGRWIIIGTDALDGKGVHWARTSQDDGTWSTAVRLGEAEDTNYPSSVTQGFGKLFVALGDGRIYRADDHLLDFSLITDLDVSFRPWTRIEVVLRYDAGHLWLGRSNASSIPRQDQEAVILFMSADGLTWNQTAEQTNIYMPIASNGSKFVGVAGFNMGWSDDGISWQESTNSPGSIDSGSLRSTDGGFQVLQYNFGPTWTATDGTNWTKASQGVATTPVVVRVMVRHRDRLIGGGDGGILVSEITDGASWERINLGEGGSAQQRVLHLTSDGSRVFATVEDRSQFTLWSSVDGTVWEEVEELRTDQIVDVAAGGGELRALGRSGGLFGSTDGGVTWSPADAPDLQQAWGIVRFAGRWIIFGSTSDVAEGTMHSSADGLVWDGSGISPGGTVDAHTQWYRIAHGNLIIGAGITPMITSDGLNWEEMGTGGPWSGGSYQEIVEVPDGYLALVSKGKRHTMWLFPHGGSDWSEIHPLQAGIVDAARVDGRLFLFGIGSIREWSDLDVALAAAPSTETAAAVGSTVSVDLTLANRGHTPLPAGDYEIGAWLSSDGVFGDGNDAAIGRRTVTLASLAPDEAISFSIGFVLPEAIPVGASRLVVRFDPEGALFERNRANNVWIGDAPAVNVIARSLDLNTIGDGTVERDFAARFYPDGATVSLSAQAGKGAVFTGWAGDALGGLSQVTVLMNGDKSVEATFSARAILQVHLRGGGRVAGLADLGSYEVGATAEVQAIPEPQWVFAGWSGASSGTAAVTEVPMDSSKSLTATFSLPIEGWRNLHFTEAQLDDVLISGDLANPDRDDLPNWQEYLHGSDPMDARSVGVRNVTVKGGYLSVIFTRNPQTGAGRSLVGQASADLTDWGMAVQERVLGTENGIGIIEARIPVEEGSDGFLRLRYRWDSD